MITKTDKKFLRIADQVAKMSDHPRFKVGAVIAKNGIYGKKIISTGYNFHHGRHAESCSLFPVWLDINFSGITMYVTHPPCADCAREIVDNRIRRVVWVAAKGEFKKRWQESNNKAKYVFDDGGVLWEECAR